MSVQTPFTSLPLARLLQEWGQTQAEPPSRLDAAQRLGEWLSAMGSVKLDGALQTISSYGTQARQPGQTVDASALEKACRQVKSEMAALIDAQALDVASDEAASEAEYGPHLQRYQVLQKQMDSKITACRAQVRQALSKGSPRLRQLAALDGVMAEMLGEREQKLLAAVPVYLERRFRHWRQVQAGVGQHGFRQDMRQMLQAELQARLQPVVGLIEAAQEENRL